MTSPLWLALATCVLVQGNVILRERHDSSSWREQSYEMRRPIRAAEQDLDDWLTDEQKAILKPLMGNSKSFKEKTMEFYALLSPEEQAKWDSKYKRECTKWVKDIADEDAAEDLANLFKEDAVAASAKWDEYVEKLPGDHREKANVWKEECRQLLTATSRRRRELDPNFVDFTKWMTDDQKSEIESLKSEGKSLTDIRAKTIGYFKALPDDQQTTLKEEYKGKCKAYFGKIATPEEMDEVKSLYETGNKGDVSSKIAAIVDRQGDDVKAVATKMQAICTDVFAEKSKKKRDIDTKIEKHLSWLTADQKQQIRDMHAAGKSKEEIRKILLGYLNALPDGSKVQAKEQTRKECYKWLEEAASKEEIDELHKLHETDHGACKAKVREYIKRLSAETRVEVEKNLPFCEKVWYGDHDHHGHHHHRRRRHLHAVEKYIDWLSPEQKEIVENMEKENVEFDDILAKVKEFFLAEADEKKEELKAKFKTECASWVKEVATEEELTKLKSLREAGEHDQVKELLRELENKLTEDRKHTVEHVRDVCYKLWEVPSRRRRDHHHTLEGVLEKYLTWTTESQKLDLKMIKESGDKSAFYNKIMEFFEESKGDTRAKAVEELKSACKHYSLDFFGDEKIAEVKKLKETGASYDAIVAKLTEYANGLGDAQKTAKALKLIDGCKRIFTAKVSRKRRDHHHTLDDAFGKYLTWITPDQKVTLKALEDAGEKEAVYKKVLEFFDLTEGETKKKAAEELKGACKHYGEDIFGEEKMELIKKAKESGATGEELKKQILDLVAGLEDDEKKAKAQKLVVGCEKIYTAAASRKRRDHHHTLEDAFTKYLTWTTDEQKQELKELKKGGDKEAIYKKILEFFDLTEGETKQKAAEELKGACKHYGEDIFGEEKMEVIKKAKESGATGEELKKQILDLVAGLEDDEKKAKAQKLVVGCEKIYTASRKRRDHHHTLEDAFTKYLTWTTDEQKEELKELKKGGDKEAIYKKILEFFDKSTGETRVKAREELQSACKHYAKDLFGEEKVDEIKTFKESGATPDQMKDKILTIVDALTDEEKKAKGKKLVDGCQRVFRDDASRKRRDHHHTLDEGFEKYLTWTTEEQKEELKKLEAAGDKKGLYSKIIEYFDDSTGAVKTTAIKEMKSACKHYAADIFGQEKVTEVKAMKDGGADLAAISEKFESLIKDLSDEKKGKAKAVVAGCKKVYEAAEARKKRRHVRHRRTHAKVSRELFFGSKIWLNSAQISEVQGLQRAGKDTEVIEKIAEFYRALGDKSRASGRLAASCRAILDEGSNGEASKKIIEATSRMETDEAIRLLKSYFGKSNDELVRQMESMCVQAYKDHHIPSTRDLN